MSSRSRLGSRHASRAVPARSVLPPPPTSPPDRTSSADDVLNLGCGSVRVGDVVDVRVGLRPSRRGVVVGLGSTLAALDVQIGSAIESVKPKRIKRRVRAAPDGRSPAGRLYATMRETSHRGALGRLKLGWDPTLLWPAIEKSADGDYALGIALDLVERGDCGALSRFSIDADDRRRLRAWQAQRLGHHREALELLLEADPRSADLPAWSIAAWMHREGGPLVTRTELLPKNGPGLVAAVLHALSKGEKLSLFDLQAISPYLRGTFGAKSQASSVVRGIDALARGETTIQLADNPAVALHRVVSGKGELAAKHAAALADWPLSLTDDLIDARRLTATASRYMPQTARARITATGPWVARRDYLLARLDPERLDDEAVVSLGFVEEAERRFLESGNATLKQGVAKSRRERFDLMRSLREMKPLDPETEERIRLEDDEGTLLAQVSSLLRTGDAAGLSPKLLRDGSIAELIATAVDAVDVGNLPERLGSTVALRRATDRLYQWDWEGAAEQARLGLRRASRESVRDEFLNLLACALWEQGRRAEAAAALEKAIQGQNNPALLANRRAVTESHRRRSKTGSDETRNPYLILGVPYGASTSEAARGFARATRRLKGCPNPPYSLNDLTWALHQVEQGLETSDWAKALFRVPANPEVYSAFGYGLLRPRPISMSRLTDRSDEGLVEELAAAAGIELLRHTLDEHGAGVTPSAPFLLTGEFASA